MIRQTLRNGRAVSLVVASVVLASCRTGSDGPLIPMRMLDGLTPTDSVRDQILSDGTPCDSQVYIIRQPIEAVVEEIKAQLPSNLSLTTKGAHFPQKLDFSSGAPVAVPGEFEKYKLAHFNDSSKGKEWTIALASGGKNPGSEGDFSKTSMTIIHFKRALR